MISIDKEKLVTFAQAAKLVPSRTGRTLHVTTIHRWASAAGARGVRLESVLVGGTRMTTVEAVQRFVDRLNDLDMDGGITGKVTKEGGK